MKESAFVSDFEKIAARVIGSATLVRRHANLLYELYLNRELKVAITDARKPSRGISAFQTDLCFYERNDKVDVPRVVIEFKTNITTHDILTYSAKAGKHKQIYPWLRYGLLATGIDSIPTRFFVHNENIDFFVAAKIYTTPEKVQGLIKRLIGKEMRTSRALESIHLSQEKFDYYQTEVVFHNFADKAL